MVTWANSLFCAAPAILNDVGPEAGKGIPEPYEWQWELGYAKCIDEAAM